jgi:hypothetical protein
MNSSSRNFSILPVFDIETAQSRRFMIPLVNCDQPGGAWPKSVPRLRCIGFVSREFNYDLNGRSWKLLLMQCDSTGKNVKQILIANMNRIAMTRSSDGAGLRTFSVIHRFYRLFVGIANSALWRSFIGMAAGTTMSAARWPRDTAFGSD